MPKKQPRNAFYFYVLSFKEEQKKQGIDYSNLTEAFTAAGPSWTKLHPSERAKYEERAKKEKQSLRGSEQKFTSTGVSFAELSRQESEEKAAIEMEIKEILNIVKLGAFNKTIQNTQFFLLDVNVYCYCSSKSLYVIAEMTMLRFSLQDGILDEYHEIINPGKLPIGYASDGKLACEELGLEMPDEDQPRTNYIQILANIMDYMKKGDQVLPPIFTMPGKVEQVQNFIAQLCQIAGEDETLFRVYKLDNLFFHLVNAIKTSEEDGFPKHSLALSRLNLDTFMYNPGLSCAHHEKYQDGDKAIHCTMSRTKRWAYTIMDMCCQKLNIDLVRGRHIPAGYDLDKIEQFKQEKMVHNRNPVACLRQLDSSVELNSSADMSMEFVLPKRVHKPLRKPKTDYVQAIRSAPEFDESKHIAGIGRGRGMNLASGMSQMRLDK